MKFVRILAILPLALVSLMNVGYAFATDPKPDAAPAIVALVSDTDGAILGLVVSSVALALAFIAGSGRRKVSLT